MPETNHANDLPWQPMRRWSLIVGVVGLAVWSLGWLLDGAALRLQAFYAYLFAFCFCLAIPLGSLAWWMVHNQTGGAWGRVIRRPLEAATRTIYLMPLLFVPLLFGLGELYLWADPEAVADTHLRELLHAKEWWLNVPFFVVRAGIYFIVWLGLAWVLDVGQRRLDRHPDRVTARKQAVLSGPGLVAYGITVTFASVDWIMSLEPEWYSTIFGALIAVAQALPALGFALAVAVFLWSRRPLSQLVVEPDTAAEPVASTAAPAHADGGAVATLPSTPEHFHHHSGGADGTPINADLWNDLGNLLLASVMLWAYMSFSQLLLIWSGNLPEEIIWYHRRIEGGWLWVGVFLAIFYFGLPFAILLIRPFKRRPHRLQWLAIALVAVSVVHYFWLISPVGAARLAGAEAGPLAVHWLDLAALAGLGGVTFAFFLWQLHARPLTPPYVPSSEEAPHE